MFKGIALGLSLLANALMAYALFPTSVPPNVSRMTCEQSRNETENKTAVREYAKARSSSMPDVHEFLTNSGYFLRNITVSDGDVTLVYAARSYWATCGFHLPGIDGGIVRVNTNIGPDPKVISVW